MTVSPSIDRLSPRHLECLRGVADYKSSKEIAQELGLEKGTVDNYLSEAARMLGARDRREAARMLALYDVQNTPNKSHMNSVGVGSTTASASARPRPAVLSRHVRLPIRQGDAGNDLTYFERFAWVPGVALGAAIGFGMLAVGLTTIGDFAVRLLGISR